MINHGRPLGTLDRMTSRWSRPSAAPSLLQAVRTALTASLVLMACGGSPSGSAQDAGGDKDLNTVCPVPDAEPLPTVFQCEGAQGTGDDPLIADFETGSGSLD